MQAKALGAGAGERGSPAQGPLRTRPCSRSGARGPSRGAAGLAWRPRAGLALPRVSDSTRRPGGLPRRRGICAHLFVISGCGWGTRPVFVLIIIVVVEKGGENEQKLLTSGGRCPAYVIPHSSSRTRDPWPDGPWVTPRQTCPPQQRTAAESGRWASLKFQGREAEAWGLPETAAAFWKPQVILQTKLTCVASVSLIYPLIHAVRCWGLYSPWPT